MLGNLHVRFGVGAGVQFHGLHHRKKEPCLAPVRGVRTMAAVQQSGTDDGRYLSPGL